MQPKQQSDWIKAVTAHGGVYVSAIPFMLQHLRSLRGSNGQNVAFEKKISVLIFALIKMEVATESRY